MGCGSVSGASQPENDDDLAMEMGGRRLDKNGNEVDKYQCTKPENDSQLVFEEPENQDDGGGGEKFMAVRPWIGALVAPTSAPNVDPSPPEMNLTLEYVNGYRAEDTRQNLYWTNTPQEIVYFSAAVGIVHDIPNNKQSFFGDGNIQTAKGHNDDIQCMNLSPDRNLAVTGQRGKNPSIFVWEVATRNVVARFNQGNGTRCVRTVKFSLDGKFIFTTDEHNDHNIHVFELATQTQKWTEKTGGDPILDMDSGAGAYSIVIAGQRGLNFFTWDGNVLSKARGLFNGKKMVDMGSCQFFNNGNSCLSGAVNGDIYIWSGNGCSRIITGVHNGAINALTVKEGQLFSSGAIDKTLKVMDVNTFAVEKSYDIGSYARAIDYKDSQIIVGTRNGSIFRIEGDSVVEIINSHSTGETWGLAICPQTGVIVTTGDDNYILCFDPQTDKVISEGIINQIPGVKKRIGGASTLSMFPPNQCARGVAISPTTGHVAVGINDGGLTIRTSTSSLNEEVVSFPSGKEWIEVLRYSPDGSKLAVGNHDNNIYIYETVSYKLVAKCAKHNSFITNLDWSSDGNTIRSICGAYELLFFDGNSGSQITSGATATRDEKWATYTCKLGWHVQGIFPPATDGSHVNGVDRSQSDAVIATGCDYGLVNLYRNPNKKGSVPKSFRAHSSHVVRVLFDEKDEYLYSVGGYDRTLMKWKVN